MWDGASLVVARILLGVGEAGFFPGVVYLIACWFPERDRGRAMSVFMLGIVIASVIGGPLSGGLLELDGVLGLEGWQWLFIGQGLPADRRRVLGAARPAELARGGGLAARGGARGARAGAGRRVGRARGAPRLHAARARSPTGASCSCAAVYFTINFASYGTIFWAADIIERVGDVEGIELGLLVGIPMALGSTGLIVIGRRSDRSGDRRRWVVIGMLLGAVGLAGTALLPAEAGVVTLGGLRVRAAGRDPGVLGDADVAAHRAARWRAASRSSTRSASAAASSARSSVGAAKDAGSLEAGLGVLACVLLVGAVLAARLPFAAVRAPAAEPTAA